MEPIHIPLADPFRFEQYITFDRQKSVILDVIHQVALILQAIQEGMALPKDDRNGYEKILLDQFGGYLAGNPLAVETALRLLVLYEDLVLPNIDLVPGELYSKHHVVRLGRSVRYEWSKDEFQHFAHSLLPLVLRHPIAQYLGIGAPEYEHLLNFSLEENSLWSYSQGPTRARNGIVVSAILQDIRTALIDAHCEGIPAASELLNNVPYTRIVESGPVENLKQQDLLVKLYFDSAIYSPKPTSVREALDIRENHRITKWRALMRQWQDELPRGKMSLQEAAEAIAEANTYIEGAKFAHHIVPRWVHVAFWPIEILAAGAAAFGLHAPEAVHYVAAGLVGAELYGHLVWLAVTKRDPYRFGWYLLANEAKQRN